MRARTLIALVLALLAAAGPAAAASPAPGSVTAGPPMDYLQIKGLSQPVYGSQIHTVYRLKASDGVQLYVEVTRPRVRGKVPVIAELSPYHGTVYKRDGWRPLPGPGGLVKYFVPRGYAVLMMDLRGTGRSQGCLDELGPRDRADIKQVIEWAASQPWSTGRVGTVGHSYPAAAGAAALSQRPRGLVTAVISAGLASMYNHQFQAGVPYDALWVGTIGAYYELSLLRHLPPGFADPVNDDAQTGDDFGKDMQYFGCGAQSSSALKGDAELTGQYVQWDRDRDFAAAAASAPVPIFAVHGENDDAARVVMLDWFLRRNGTIRANGEPVVDKLWLGQWTHGVGCCPNRRGEQWTGALHAWLDKQLQQRDVDTGPPVEVFLADGPQDDAVPSGRTEIFTTKLFPGSPNMVPFYPAPNGAMTRNNGLPGSVSFSGEPFGGFSSSGTNGVRFRTAPFTSDVLMLGVPQLKLVVSETTPMLHFIANLFEENERGELRRLSQFAINSALRNGLDTVSPAFPFTTYELHPPGWPMMQHMRKGDSLVLQVTTSDPDKFPFFATDPNVTVFTGRGGTVLEVPVIDDPVLYPDTLPLG